MLMHIHIHDFATIETLQLELDTGCTMITGETGAGKSIFIEAIEFALGGRGSAHLVRQGKDKAEVSLTFDITKFAPVISLLKSLDLYQDNAECLIRRTFTNDGRSRCYVNGLPATLPLVKELGEFLFHLHGQYDQQVLLKSDTQRDMLDRYGDLLSHTANIKTLSDEWRALETEKNNLQGKIKERTERIDYLQFQLEELNALHLTQGEWETLEAEHLRLMHAEELIHQVQSALTQFNGEEQSILKLSHDVRKIFESIATLEPHARAWLDSLQSALIQFTDIESELQHYLDNRIVDPEKLHEIEQRVSTIFNLSRKYKIAPATLANFTAERQQELAALQQSEMNIANISEAQEKIMQEYQVQSKTLTGLREQSAKKLAEEITTTMRSLSLPHGEFSIALLPLTHDHPEPTAYGQEKIVFMIKTNPDTVLQPLSKVISGGELSRLSLSMHLALSARTSIPTLIFDEVDTGLSGATAEKIGRLLHKLGMGYQVFCVTHQPQVAACGHHHLLVQKDFIDNTTHTTLRLLSATEKTKEIARMLGGEKITKKTLEHAREVLEKG